jgi:hypothetical protein
MPVGIVLMLVGLWFGSSILVEYLRTGVVTRFAATILSALCILSGLQIVCFGLLTDTILTNVRRSNSK